MNYELKTLKYKEFNVFIRLSMPKCKRVQNEQTEEKACFIFVNKGQLSIRASVDYIKLDVKTALLARCQNHFYESQNEGKDIDDGFDCTGVFLYPSLVKELFEFDITRSDHSFDFNLKKIEVDGLLESFRQGINILIENPELADENMIKTKLKEFVLLISKSQNIHSQLDFLAGMFKPVEIEFKSTIQQNLYSDLSLGEIATLCNMSMSSFNRKFRLVFDDSPKNFITRKKMERAARLLTTTDLNVSAIALKIGFDSFATFNRNFRKFYKKSPSEYRLN